MRRSRATGANQIILVKMENRSSKHLYCRYFPIQQAITEIRDALRGIPHTVEAQLDAELQTQVSPRRHQENVEEDDPFHNQGYGRIGHTTAARLQRIISAEVTPGDSGAAVAIDLPGLSDLLHRLGRTREVEHLRIIGAGGAPVAAASFLRRVNVQELVPPGAEVRLT